MPLPDRIVLAAIEAMPSEFDSHDFIVHVMRENPQEYVRQLYAFVETKDPILQGHADIGRQLTTVPTIKKLKDERPTSGNVRRGENDNQLWRKKPA